MSDFSLHIGGDESQRWLDRLVDGELACEEQRGLLDALESQPDGWRRCALAFIEAQTWREEMASMGGELRVEGGVSSSMASLGVAVKSSRRWGAIAAGLLIAFALGAAAGELFLNKVSPTVALAPSQRSEHPLQAITVSLPSAGGEGARTVEVPLVEADEASWKNLLAEQTPGISDSVCAALERLGHRVELTRAYYPVKLDDGREAVLPVDLVELQSHGAWQ